MAHELPPLPYDDDAWSPHIDEQTMRSITISTMLLTSTTSTPALEGHPDLAQRASRSSSKTSTACRKISAPPSQQRWWARQPHALLGDGQARRCQGALG